jgi:D-xylose 1-dehydrogenase (NADP+, D-xylono-1,5-lactone-forming)
MERIRWGIISTAFIGRTQVIPAMFRADNAEAAAIASRSSKVHGVAEELKIPKAYESYEALLADPDIDAVYIPLPNHLHKKWVLRAAEHGKHVLCEKPAALTAREAKEMAEGCRKQNVKFSEAFMYQLHPQHARVKEIIASGEIGEVKLIKSSHSFYLENREGDIRMDKAMGGGSLYDVGCYSISVIRHLLAAEPVKVQAISKDDPKSGVDLSAFVHLSFEGGVQAVFDSSFDTTNRMEYEVVGTRGTIRVPFAFRPDTNRGIGVISVKVDDQIREEEIAGDIFRLEIERFSDAILNDGEPFISAESTINNMRVIEACYASMQAGGQAVAVNG